MDLSDEEIMQVWTVLHDDVYYGDDEIVYGFSDDAVNRRSALEKIGNEIKARGI